MQSLGTVVWYVVTSESPENGHGKLAGLSLQYEGDLATENELLEIQLESMV